MILRVSLPEAGVDAVAELYTKAAPNISEFVWTALDRPLQTRTAHACFDGHEVYCFLNTSGKPPEAENVTIRPRPGDIMYFYAPAGKFAAVNSDDRLRGQTPDVHELAFVYGEVDLRHYWEEGWIGSIVGRIVEGLPEFAKACKDTLQNGSTPITVARGD